MLKIRLKSDVSAITRRLDSFAKGQLPFATAQALNRTGRLAIEAERAAMLAAMPTARPFTVKQGLRLAAARKQSPEAVVFIPPIQARYLAPEIEGGVQVLSGTSRAILRPIDQATDRYGNLPRGLLARLRGRSDIFIGPMQTRAGIVHGVWQRLAPKRITKRNPNPQRGLKLLIKFADPVAVKVHYAFGQATMATAKAEFAPILREELVRAMRTAR